MVETNDLGPQAESMHDTPPPSHAGRTERLAGNMEAAAEHLNSAERLRPTHLPALLELRTLAGDTGDDALALRVGRLIKRHSWRQKQQRMRFAITDSESDAE